MSSGRVRGFLKQQEFVRLSTLWSKCEIQNITQVDALADLLGFSVCTGVLAAYVYYKSGFVDLPAATWISLGFVLGGYLGARFAVSLNPEILRRVFGVFALIIGIRMLWGQ
ncbi:MAG: sulfite exporter TauE/SafE family protein [Leptospirales bacterium]|nr:sulfite exporter TauE/SafE family protein [Leptospirales bacterium]